MLDDQFEHGVTENFASFLILSLMLVTRKCALTVLFRMSPSILPSLSIARARHTVLGVSVAYSEADIRWRTFLESLVERKQCWVECIVSDDHAGLTMARKAVFTVAKWQRCQFHLSQNAVRHASSKENQKVYRRGTQNRLKR